MMTIEEIAKLKLNKNWSGPWTFLECCYYGKVYTSVLKKRYGIGLDSALFVSHSGVSSNFLVENELEICGRGLAEKIEEDMSLAYAWGNDAKKQGDRAISLMRSIEGKEITPDDYHELWGMLFEYLLVIFPIKRGGDYLKKQTLDKLLPTFEEVRVYGEPVFAQAAIFIKKFADQLSKKIGLTQGQILSMTDVEMEKFFSTNELPSKDVLDKRFECSALVISKGDVAVFAGEEARKIEAAILKLSSQNEIRGTVAYKGVAKGKVRIVFDPQKILSFDEPTVLVTGMTRPEYLHLFREAVAVVTDAGGVLSHAAITAREFKKPAIIGTEIATKVLKDGDMVEVDAEKGLVKVLKKA